MHVYLINRLSPAPLTARWSAVIWAVSWSWATQVRGELLRAAQSCPELRTAFLGKLADVFFMGLANVNS